MVRLLSYGILAMLLGLNACVTNQANTYKLHVPTEGFRLDSELNEISGLHYYSDSIILAVQDEEGILYYLNSNNGQIIDTYRFGKKGDYEGVTANKNDIYVLKSNGDITLIKRKKDKTKTYDFKNSKGFDFEGLCMDKENKRLLVACKTHGEKDKNDFIRIYEFSLQSMSYAKHPAFKIPKDKVSKLFSPSAIAIHPDGNIYLLSSTAKMLLILSSAGEILQKRPLFKDIFNQPEGITFAPNGDLFISNEKKNKYPTLLKFIK